MGVFLDYIEGPDFEEEFLGKHWSELRTLAYLQVGLQYLYNEISAIERKLRIQVGNEVQMFITGKPPGLEWVPSDLISCAFRWYCNDVVTYVRFVGWLMHKTLGPSFHYTEFKAYSTAVIPKVVEYRDKVAAHPAKLDPRKEDTPADLEASVLYPVTYSFDGRFHAAAGRLGTICNGIPSTSRDWQWSLTQTHEALSARYWPESVKSSVLGNDEGQSSREDGSSSMNSS
jgi:hypothetical protein